MRTADSVREGEVMVFCFREAEWVRLDYGPGSPIFTFTVDLEEERA